ncbi:RRQRL motif-containing zinc-binding protein [Actinoplanes sp. GCM10030250]|uniref:RRQRL motif-containing zinc-binding protein n=1 Tax=Actinoplanes sp. GCM10030250 TaxID=3273376 RepID=UPI003608CB78
MTTSALTNDYLEALGARTGIRIEFYDPTGNRYGFPTFPYRMAPDGLATRRQLRADGLRPGGYDPVAQILWRHKAQRRIAYLYRRDLAKPKRTATPAQRAVIADMLRRRRTCPACGVTHNYYIPRRTGICLSCDTGGH